MAGSRLRICPANDEQQSFLRLSLGQQYELIVASLGSYPLNADGVIVSGALMNLDVLFDLLAEAVPPVVMVLDEGLTPSDRMVIREMGGEIIPWPIVGQELQHLVSNLIRRQHRCSYEFESITIGREQVSVKEGDRFISVPCTSWECELLIALAQFPSRVLSRSTIAEIVWDTDAVSSNRIDRMMSRLRQKLSPDEPNRFIQTVRGIGYRLSV